MSEGSDPKNTLLSYVEVFNAETQRRRDLNHEIHRIHGNGRARWSHRNPLSFVVRPSPCQERKEDGWLDRGGIGAGENETYVDG